MRPDDKAATPAAYAHQIDTGRNAGPPTVANLVDADTPVSEPAYTSRPVEIQVTGLVRGLHLVSAMARDTAERFAAAAEVYLGSAGPQAYAEQHVTGRDGTRYVITFRRFDGRRPDDLPSAAQAALDRLTAAILRLADRLDTHSHHTRVLSVRATLRDISASLRTLVQPDPASHDDSTPA